ncbi:hypothetical protein [Robertkochia flava]|uniref:hypothetical protein n=1 Tax=Robertkochia flava TaxID=3447986 RepID=UPI001CC95E74|nr:hypothetical protein [Robertkochia marina]
MFPESVLDIKFQGKKAYILNQVNLTSKMVEEQLDNMSYSGEGKTKSKDVENTKLPPFIYSFYFLVFNSKRIPSEKEFLNHYFGVGFKLENGKYYNLQSPDSKPINIEAVKGRALRTYPSLIRDYHFFLMCTESKLFDKVTYSIRQDYKNGVDLIITQNEVEYSISLKLASKRSNVYKSLKYNRHDYSDKKEIVLDLDREKDAQLASNFYLFKKSTLNLLLKKIETYER